MGQVIPAAAKDKILKYIDKGSDEGSNLILDGRIIELPEGLKNRYWVTSKPRVRIR